MKIGIKYCGGCNPAYDRIAAAEKIISKISKRAKIVAYTDTSACFGSALQPTLSTSDIDLIIAFMGCSTACANLEGVDMGKVKILCSESDVELFDIENFIINKTIGG